MMSLLTLPTFSRGARSGAARRRLSRREGARIRQAALEAARDAPLLLTDPLRPGSPPERFGHRELLEFSEGAVISDFDPCADILEIEVPDGAQGQEEIEIVNGPPGCGVRVLLNGRMVAEIRGIRGLDRDRIVLRAV